MALCRDLGADVAVDYADEADGDFAAAVMAETGGRGVDVVFDNVGKSVFERSLDCLAYDGRYVMMGFASNKAVADEPFVVPRRLMLANATLCGVMLNYQTPDVAGVLKDAMGWNVATTDLGARIQSEIVERYRAGRIRAVVGEVVPFEELPRAIDALAARRTIGRVVVTL